MEPQNVTVEPREENAGDRAAFWSTFPPKEGSPPTLIQWSRENHCYIVNGIEAAIPISAVHPITGVINNEAPARSPTTSDASGSKKRNKRTERQEEFIFKLFKFPKPEKEEIAAKKEKTVEALETYLLEIHEIETCNIDRHKVFINETNGMWKAAYEDLMPGDSVVVEVLQDPIVPIFKKTYDIPLGERLKYWSKENRPRNMWKTDTFYYHRNKQFRSFIEVITFVIYSCNVKDLMSTNKASQEVPESGAAEEMVTYIR